MEMEKKNLAIIVLAIALAASGVGNIILGVLTGAIQLQPGPSNTLVVGWGSNPAALDPVDTWDVPSHVMQHQSTQGLVEYNLSTHPDYEIKMVLAIDYTWETNLRCTFELRHGVQFHDGTAMTAEDVKWNFERVVYFSNATGTLPANSTSWVGFPSSLFFHSDGTPIFASFEADDDVDPYEFTIVLNKPFGALLDLICFGATNILSPESTPRYTYLDLADDDIVGTGPYDYLHFKRDWEVRYVRFDNYWGPKPYYDEVVCSIVEEDTARMTAGLAGQYDYVGGVIKTYIDTFKADSNFHVEDVGEDLCYFYLEIYCGPMSVGGTMLVPGNPQYQKNPAYLRRALALAINYTYIYEEIQSGYAVEGTTAVPRAMPGHNASVIQASDSSFTWEENIVKARQILQANAADIVTRGGLDCSSWNVSDDLDWLGKDLIGRPLEINRHFGSNTNLNLNLLMTDNFDMIGIQITETIREWGVYLDTGENTPWLMDIGYVGWCPDYLNPFNMIDPLFNLASGSCFSRINDTSTGGLTELMNAAAAETDLNVQLNYYMKIQSLIYDITRPLNPASHAHISGWVYLVQQTHKVELKGVQYNVMTMQEYSHWYKE
jgi:peptide/nickel transport system substrate-binding protein